MARRARGALEGNGEAQGSSFMELFPPPFTSGIFQLGWQKAEPLNSAFPLRVFACGLNFNSPNLPE